MGQRRQYIIFLGRGYLYFIGNIFMVDRMKEMIKVKALQVSPSELEDLLRHHHEVHDAAVLGIPNDRMGEVPQAFVVKKNRKVRAINLEKHTEGSLERDDLNFKEEVKTPTLKVARTKLMNSMHIRMKTNHAIKDIKVQKS